ncbi:MinD/ParA family protein [Coralloluteibacterium stylophorae]|uniref:MinD/ParA family protein n=1 Tax=Coralloluteibacterium stylophorae TaxID=1776034 RepID=A0A8J7VSR9_9GAMM|nr:MinD/ParA family protein [Coralloluteibacterium stylophorae]MBS7457241.1 MinD/ParA family protein [Coralloluteibacterium stylophorae]
MSPESSSHPASRVPEQAAGLVAARRPPVRVITVTSGKGGVGKTNVSVNLGVALAAAGRKPLLLDADLGLANVDVMLGLSAERTLADVMAGRCGLADTILEGPHGLGIVPASSGKRHMAELTPAEHVGLIRAFSEIDRPLDTMLVDTAAGVTDSVLTFCQAAQDVIVVVCDEPASITDAYALIKVLSRERGVNRVQVLTNQVGSPQEGRALYEKLARVSDKFLDVTLAYLGMVPHDEYLRRAVQRQLPVTVAYPSSPSARAFRELAGRIERWQPPAAARGHLEFFVERMIDAGGMAA